MEENRYQLTGTLIFKGEVIQHSPYFKRREFKLRFSDIDFNGKIIERFPVFRLINDHCMLIEEIPIDSLVQIEFYLDGRDYVKEGKTMNFTSPVCYDISMISNSEAEEGERNAIVTENGLVEQEKEATVEDLIRAGAYLNGEDDPLNNPDIAKHNKEKKAEEKKPEGHNEVFPVSESYKTNTELDELPF